MELCRKRVYNEYTFVHLIARGNRDGGHYSIGNAISKGHFRVLFTVSKAIVGEFVSIFPAQCTDLRQDAGARRSKIFEPNLD